MPDILLIILILSAYVIVHSYLVYPLFMILFTSEKERQKEKFSHRDHLPSVSILMAAYNEEQVIGEKIASVFNTSYPLDKIIFHIGSDASTDKTDAIVEDWQKKIPQIKLVRFGGRTGKSGIINALAESAEADVFILTDANVIFGKDTIFNLLRHFKDENVAQVCANIIKVSKTDKGIASQEKSYIAIENRLKFLESQRWNMVMGAEGGCYAIRKNSFAPVPPKFYMDDFYITLNVLEQRKEILFDKGAIAHEDVSTQANEEYKRKIRISIGNFQNLFRYKKLLFPPWKGSAFAFWSHKVCRWMTPFSLLICFITSALLSLYYPFFIWITLLQGIGFVTPFIDRIIGLNIKLLRFISHFYLMNLALLHGFIVYARGVDSNVWQPTKRELN
jgi:cellulose synthase/poly-beta-1,6-N-acetylglucosamine synthase-like glycosyltransferase